MTKCLLKSLQTMPGYRYKGRDSPTTRHLTPNTAPPDTHPSPPEGRGLSMLLPISLPLWRIRLILLIRLIGPNMPDKPDTLANRLIINCLPICRLLACKRPSITMQKVTFRIMKGGLLRFIRSSGVSILVPPDLQSGGF